MLTDGKTGSGPKHVGDLDDPTVFWELFRVLNASYSVRSFDSLGRLSYRRMALRGLGSRYFVPKLFKNVLRTSY